MEDITQQEINEVFGVEGTESQQEGSESVRETEAQEPVQEGAEAPQEAKESLEASETDVRQVRQEMPAEERHRQAAARRAREEQARAEAEQARRDQIYADLFAGQADPYTGKPILTEADFRAYQSERDRRRQTAQLEKAGIDPGAIKGIVSQELAPIQERLQRAEMAAMQEKARAVNARAEESIRVSLKNISAMDPSVKSLEDIAALPTAARFNELVQKGVGLEDAFYLANRKAIDERKAAAVKAAALNGAVSRKHLDPVGAGGSQEAVEVPAEQRAAYREMFPDATDAEIDAAYRKFLKDLK
ncbi:hypothetical protein [uncultured Dysosmobacter sp.]|uniref:hypothetical protein n=1 Tax=uncultured Dysosmobacter sp. TaxID=2591384 RepID=UPI00262385F5|nr:hypothetical protein [uncultured Dysosmobacter sp.]